MQQGISARDVASPRDQVNKQSTKHRSRSENMQKVCLFYSQNNKIVLS